MQKKQYISTAEKEEQDIHTAFMALLEKIENTVVRDNNGLSFDFDPTGLVFAFAEVWRSVPEIKGNPWSASHLTRPKNECETCATAKRKYYNVR